MRSRASGALPSSARPRAIVGEMGARVSRDLLPLRLNIAGQIDEPVRMMPTDKGLAHYLLRLDPDPDANADLWKRLNDSQNRTLLNGMNRLGEPNPGATVTGRSGMVVKRSRAWPFVHATPRAPPSRP